MTLDRARISLGSADQCSGLAYVALSRVRTKEGLLIDSQFFDSARLTGVKLKKFATDFDIQTEILIRNTHQLLDVEEGIINEVESDEINEPDLDEIEGEEGSIDQYELEDEREVEYEMEYE
jgi:hypothetical protein